MEKAIFTNEPEKYDLTNYDRIYFGNEFCENNFISFERVKEIVKLVKDQKKEITFVTPFVTDKGLKVIENFLEEIPKGSEVVFNDYGVLSLIETFSQAKGFKPVFGRLLNRQKRGPRIVQLKDKLPQKGYEYFQHCNLDVMGDFLDSKNIQRAEIDNVIQEFKVKTKLNLSLYYPWVYVSTTRLCLVNGIENLARKKISICPCKRECHKYILVNDKFPLKLYQKGVTQFYFNDKLPSKGYDRLVYVPEMIV
ncbi:MAG: hypothetical protein ABIH82_06385 [Candidatus Woesearchaeota archaeon]